MKKCLNSTLIATCLLLPTFSSPSFAEKYIGEIFWVGFNFCPRGSASADGQLLPISEYSALFSLLGTMYGGDGRSTFALPDLRGRSAVHHGSGAGLSNISIGQKGGAETVTLSTNQLPSHQHGTSAIEAKHIVSKLAATTAEPEAKMLADGQRAAIYTEVPVAAEDQVELAAESVVISGQTDAAGTGESISIRSPYLGIKVCITLDGIFPSRS